MAPTAPVPRWHNPELEDAASGSTPDVAAIRHLLREMGMFRGPLFRTGLRPAVALPDGRPHPSYRYAWLRDNMHLAYADIRAGRHEPALRTVQAWLSVMSRHFLADEEEQPSPPPVKVDGESGVAPHEWPQTQNDALGLLIWVAAQLIESDLLAVDEAIVHTVRSLGSYLEATEYWIAEDSGHWEEERRRNASSIGCVVAGIEAWASAADRLAVPEVLPRQLVDRGRHALAEILPWETPAEDPRPRRHDAALIFLVEPLKVIKGEAARTTIESHVLQLGRDIGLARYLGDSYWAPDYRSFVAPDELSADYSDRITERDRLARPGLEAQWTLFDPWVSVFWGNQHRRTQAADDLDLQQHHVIRSLAAVTGASTDVPGRLPEAYFLEHGRWVPNDQVPLLWSEANLEIALLELEANLASTPHSSDRSGG